jgi:uncharacterized protein YrrD
VSTTEPFVLSAALGRRVVAQDTADEVGTIKAVVIDRSGRQIERIQVAGNKRKPRLVDWSAIATFGPDAVLLAAHDDVGEAVDARDEEVVRGDVAVIGARILDTAGFEHGRVADVEFDPVTGAVVGIVGDAHHVDADQIRSLGTWALVVDRA